MAIFQGKATEIESNLNKVAKINSESTEVQYPSAKAVYDFGQCVMITDTGTDLNDYKEQGVYFFGSDVTPVNIPVGTNGWLEVFHSTQHGQYRVVKQIWYILGTSSSNNDYWTYVRSYTDNYGWGQWYQVHTDADIEMKAVSVSTGTLTTTIKNLWANLATGKAHLIKITYNNGGTAKYAFAYGFKMDNSNGRIIYFPFNTGSADTNVMFSALILGGTWTISEITITTS